MSKRVLSLFSGAGGAVVGFENAGYDVVAAVDFDEDCCATVEANHDDLQVIQEDLSEIGPHEFALEYDVAPSDVDVVVGGPPCQGFSLQGERNEGDDRNELVTDFLDYVSLYDPDRFVMENVEGMLSMSDGQAVEYVHERGSELGYTVDHELLSADKYGVPQRRRRVVFVGVTYGGVSWPTETGRVKTVRDAFDDVNESHENHVIHNSMPKAESKISDTEPGDTIYDSYMKNVRLQWDEPAPTLVSSGGAWQFGHPTEDRVLTVHERALLQSFPQDYVFEGGVTDRRIQTGNALPPKMAEYIARAL